MKANKKQIFGWVLSGLIAAFLIFGSGIGKLISGEELDVVNVRLETILPEEQKDHARVIR